jgi:alpha/beta superfamily hydrolase
MESVAFKSARGEHLSGALYRQPNPSTTTVQPCVLLVHGLMSDKTVPVLTHFVSQLTPHITCIMFDFPGQGESEGAFEYGGYQHQVLIQSL